MYKITRDITYWTCTREAVYSYLLTPYWLTPCNRVVLEKLTGFQLLKKFPAFYVTRRFITTVTSVRHLSLSWAKVQVRGLLFDCFATWYFIRWGLVSTSPNPQSGIPPFVCCPRLLFQYIRSYCPYWRPFLHPQPADTPCDRDLLTAVIHTTFKKDTLALVICPLRLPRSP